tara:strand:- start:9145 stop:9462 length:318 start_codon:yes stop_codon:yes gene_type:complete
MTKPTFMNVVRFKLKSECVDQYFEVHGKFICEGLTDRYIAKTGDDSYCFVGLWDNEEALVRSRPKMLAHLDEVRGFMKELSSELGVTDPVSGTIVAYGAEQLGSS